MDWDVIILGAGGAGMMCAARAARRGRRVLLLDHGEKLGKKILISGGGRCNFTNIGAAANNYFSQNEHFAKSAFARFTPHDFLELIEKHKVPYYEKKLGQLFCKDSAQRIVDLLWHECEAAGVKLQLGAKLGKVEKREGGGYFVENDGKMLSAESVVVATGGLSIPKIGATDFGYKVARSFGLKTTALDPALVMLGMDQEFLRRFASVSGASVDCLVEVNGRSFRENVLFTHTGLSGPAILQVSLFWFSGDTIRINLSPERSLEEYFFAAKRDGVKKEVRTLVAELFTERLGEKFMEEFHGPTGPVNQVTDQALRDFAARLHNWQLKPTSTGGYGRAEVTRGGVSTEELSSKTMEAKKAPGLFFIGEVVDVTGMLGGYNFQWAWSSAVAAAEHV
jgi:predicted Rossmann fold flavoprotein